MRGLRWPTRRRAGAVLIIAAAVAAAGCTASIAPETSSTASTTSPPAAQPPPVGFAIDLPAEPWWGGPTYYAAFPKALASGWSSSGFFPISVFAGRPSHAVELHAAGINTFMAVEHDGSPISMVTDEGISVVAQDEWTADEIGDDPRVVGWFISDECESSAGACAFDDEQPRVTLQSEWVQARRDLDDGRFLQANFGNGVLGTYWAPTTMGDHIALMDVVSVDKYAYTSQHVQRLLADSPYWPDDADPGSSAAYGWLQERMASFDATKPNWVFVETAMPYLEEDDARTIDTAEIGGAVWNALIHGAAGIAYFQHNNNGVCGNYSIIQCGAERTAAIRSINAQVTAMAPVLNSPSYSWQFGTGLQTALKVVDDYAYILAMTDGTSGIRSFSLPPSLRDATAVEVVDEGRSIEVDVGAFVDDFDAEYTHHIYRIALPGS